MGRRKSHRRRRNRNAEGPKRQGHHPSVAVEQGATYAIEEQPVVEESSESHDFGGVRLEVARGAHYQIRNGTHELRETVEAVAHDIEQLAFRLGFTVWVVWMVVEKVYALTR